MKCYGRAQVVQVGTGTCDVVVEAVVPRVATLYTCTVQVQASPCNLGPDTFHQKLRNF